MRRPASFAVVFLALLALAVAPAAHAQEPSIVTDITFPEEGEAFGTFTAEGPLCPSGTFADQVLGGGGAFRSGRVFYGSATVLKTFTCTSGDSGTFMILFHPQFNPSTSEDCLQAGSFSVVGGTGAYTSLSGHGDFCLIAVDDEFHELFTGTFRLQ